MRITHSALVGCVFLCANFTFSAPHIAARRRRKIAPAERSGAGEAAAADGYSRP